MSDASKENVSQEEKLVRWRLEREKRHRNETESKPSCRKPRPAIRPLPNRDRRASTTAQSTPLQNVPSLLKSTPFSQQSSSGSKVSFLSDKSRSSYMQPTKSSVRRSLSTTLSRKPLAPVSANRISKSLISKRKTCGALSKPAVRAPPQTSSSVSSSFLQLSDTPHYPEVEEDDYQSTPVMVKSIDIFSPRLPSTSPLSVFSPTDSQRGAKTPSAKATEGSNSSATQTECQNYEHPEQKNRASPLSMAKETDGLPNQFKVLHLENECFGEEVSGHKSTGVCTKESSPSCNQPIGFSPPNSDMLLERVEEQFAASAATHTTLDDELPELNAALDEFSKFNLSFNLDSSSDEEGPYQPSRISRERSRALGPILPIPSLRDDLSDKVKTNTPTEQESPNVDESQSTPFMLSPAFVLSPNEPTEEVSIELTQSSSSRAVRDRSRNLGLLLPIPSLRDDLSNNTKQTTENESRGTHGEGIKNDEIESLEMPSPFEQSRTPTQEDNSLSCLPNIDEDDDDDDMENCYRTSRDRSRKLGPILPIPSLRDDSSNDKSVASELDAKTERIGVHSKTPTDEYTGSPQDQTLNQNDEVSEDDSQGDDIDDYSNRLAKNMYAPPDEPIQLELCSPMLENISSRRGRRSSIRHSIPLSRLDTNSSPAVLAESPINYCDQDFEKPFVEGSEKNNSSPHFLDSMPLVKYKDRHLLTTVPEESSDMSIVEALQKQLSEALKENRQQAEKLARYNRSYEDRVTPYRDLFEEWRQEKRRWRATEASHTALVEEVQSKFSQALQLSFQKCQDLQAQLQASEARVAALLSNSNK